MRISYCGIRFFFTNVLKRNWHIFTYLNVKKERRLPAILSREEVYRVLNHLTTLHNYVLFSTIYSCGLRISEALNLTIADIDSSRMMIHVHRGKGAKDRMVPLPEETLNLLRQYWATHRNPKLLFPTRGRGNNHMSRSQKPMASESVQKAFRQARYAAGIKKQQVTPHTLRHCYATHLLEAGTNPRVIQRYMGHSNLETTMIYFHLTQKGAEDSYRIINHVMRGFVREQNH